jgi:hypothetical protein
MWEMRGGVRAERTLLLSTHKPHGDVGQPLLLQVVLVDTVKVMCQV